MPVARRRHLTRLLVLGAIIGLIPASAIAQVKQMAVLSLYGATRDAPTAAAAEPLFRRILGDGLAGHLDYYPEYLDLARFTEPSYQEALRDFLRSKYKGRRFDLIVATTKEALDFVRVNRDGVFPGTPVVFTTRIWNASDAVPNATGLISRLNFKDSLDSAIRIHPDTERVVVISGASAWDKTFEAIARDHFRPLEGRLAFTYLTGLPLRELLRQVAVLPPRSIIFYTSMYEEGDGQKFPPAGALDRLSAAANSPTYSWMTVTLNHGAVGGRMVSMDALMTQTADLALRVLRGERPETIPVTEVDITVTEFDWRQMRRWGITESRLPAGSTILNRQTGAWELYQPYIIGAFLLLMLQSTFIGALLVQRARRVRVERALRESEERFRLMADTAPVLVWRADTANRCDFVNRPWLEFTGRTMEQELGNGWAEGICAEDLNRSLRTCVTAFDARQPFRMEFRLRRADGAYRWVLDTGVPRYGPDGSFAGYIGSCLDITDRKESEDALHESQQRLTMATAAGAVGVWDWNFATNELYVDPGLKSLLGFEDAEITNRPDDWGSRVHPQDLPTAAARMQACIDGDTDVYEVEHRMVHKDGSARWFLSRGSATRRADGSLHRMVGTKVDITERKRAEEEIRQKEAVLQVSDREIQNLVGRLISAQEIERSRIARDLHDDTSQQLAGLAIALGGLKRRVRAVPGDETLPEDVSSLQQRTIELAEDVRLLSHALHPSVLVHAGLVAALAGHCTEVQRLQTLAVTFTAEGDFESTDEETALCLYRIAQEALRNVVAHAEASQADVRLRRTGAMTELTIADDGKGFDVVTTRESSIGMGLVSIHERVRLAGGSVNITTELNKGTQLRVQIPGSRRVPTDTGDQSGRYATSA
jgi:PAS domain S-box-containing protein